MDQLADQMHRPIEGEYTVMAMVTDRQRASARLAPSFLNF
jgi:hypothetical protein